MILTHLIEEAIFITYEKNPHCFTAGCGKETFAFWLHYTTQISMCPKMLRRYMMKLVSQKYFRIYKSISGHTCFDLKNKGKNYIKYSQITRKIKETKNGDIRHS